MPVSIEFRLQGSSEKDPDNTVAPTEVRHLSLKRASRSAPLVVSIYQNTDQGFGRGERIAEVVLSQEAEAQLYRAIDAISTTSIV